ncbi:MAG: M20/M25/M40 family metallo-hydrolase [Planctomycetota bacterium]|nr:M20/M25/M40 family metallo-hydrolase [Planctomycetota bacterium]
MDETTKKEPEKGARLAWLTLVTALALYSLCLLRATPPDVVPAIPASALFSAERALEHLVRIEGSGRPHPIGSSENARVRSEVIAAFAALGIPAEVDEHIAVGANRVVAITRNIVARLPKTASSSSQSKSVLVCAHHDSVSAGPGTSDDGVGVAAALEIARALQLVSVRKNDVVFLIDDGEEAGLIGARSFLARHPLARDVGVVVNMEARGTNGRAQMFETSTGNRSLIAALAAGVPHPSATSVAYELYKAMPNDTDMTVFKEAGLAGVNFAFIGGVSRYHTPLDDIAHLDVRSLQHIGESALGITREFVDRDLTALSKGDSVYADVLGFALLHFPTTWMWPLAILALLASAWCARRVRLGLFFKAFIALAIGFVATLVAALAISSAITTVHAATFPWSAHPAWSRIAVLLGSFAIGILATRLVARRFADAAATRCAALVLYALIGAGACTVVPSASYLFVFPVLAAGVVSACGARAQRWSAFAAFVVAALFTLPVLIGVEDGFGYGAPSGFVVPVGCVVALLVVLACSSFVDSNARALAASAAAAALALVVALCVPAFDEDSPAWLNIVHEHDARSGEARWIAVPVAAPMPRELLDAAAFERRENAFEDRLYAGARAGFVALSAPSLAAPPRLDLLTETNEGSHRIVRARLWSPRGALRLVVRTPSDANLRSIARAVRDSGGRFVADESEKLLEGFSARGVVRFTGIDAAGLVLEFMIDARDPIDVEIVDASADMPDEFETLSRARPKHYVPRGEGDVSVIQERVRL